MFFELAGNTWGEEESAAIRRVLDSGQFTMGKYVREFEQAFAARLGARHAVMVNSGSSANLVGVAAFCFKKDRPLARGDEVIVPAIAWATTYAPLQQYGLAMKVVDVELDTLNMDVSQLEAALTPRTRMVVAASILGNPCALDVIRAFCDRHGLYFLEDNCESLGAELGGRPCGRFGDVGTFSFFFSHHMSLVEGGMLLTDDAELADLARALRAHGWTRDLSAGTSLVEPRGDSFHEAYRFILPGYNVRPLEFTAAAGLEQLKKLDPMVALRRKNAEAFTRRFAGDPRFIIQREHGTSSWFAFTVILNPALGINRAAVMQGMKDAGIGYRMITGGCVVRHEFIKHFDWSTAGPIVHANTAHDHGFFVGNHPQDLTPQIARLHEVLDRAAVPA
jgi:CDP-6-deoxy-D-xylo-4-hexulose-3-dehydrase